MGIDWISVLRYGGDWLLTGMVAVGAYLVWRGGKARRRGRRRLEED